MKRNLVLAIETGIKGGSISLFDDGEEIGCWEGDKRISKAEELLVALSALLVGNNASPKEINNIYINKGPGNFTGLRIGIATGKGLQKAIGCGFYGIGILEALSIKGTGKGVKAVAIRLSEEQIWWQVFSNGNTLKNLSAEMPRKITLQQLVAKIENGEISNWILEKTLYEQASELFLDNKRDRERFIEVFEPMSKILALAGIREGLGRDVLPICY